VQILNGLVLPVSSDYSVGANNVWNDPEVVDAHAHSSYTYDYYYKRFGRRGLDNADKRIWNVTHLVRRSDIFAATDLNPWLNASYFGNGLMYYGEGCVCTFVGQRYNYLSGALDVVAHELTHGVTQYTSSLLYLNESGALNEAFSDIMGTSVEFFFQPIGSGPGKADYLIGEDVITAGLPGTLDGIRSMENPALYGQPDHYSKRFIGTADNGGVHINSGIANQAFYLAIEGGTNRTSGISVVGVGASNRDQIEKVFYRAFAQLMPSTANFSMARAITLQAAQDLYGLNSAPYNSVRAAWTAVGVN
jgi:Zn-dependent metalloprotease